MAKNKAKREIASKIEVPSSEILDKDAKVSENPRNKTDDIEVAEVVSTKASTSNDKNLNSLAGQGSYKYPNQDDTKQEEIPFIDDQTPEDIQKSEPNLQKNHPHANAPPVARVVKQEKQNSSIYLMLIGGIISSAFGFGAAYYLFTSNILTNGVTIKDVQSELSINISGNANGISQNAKTNGDQDTQLNNIIAKLETHDDHFEALSGSLASMTNLSETVDALNARVDSIEMLAADISQLMRKLEKRPVAATLSDEIIDAYNSEVNRLLETMAAQRKEVETLLHEANTKKAQASEVARNTQANLTFNAIQTAFNAGKSFAKELDEFSKLTNAPIPTKLQKISGEGVPRLETLTDTFPEAARAAISAERSENSYDGTAQSLLGFIKSQLQARSVTPKEGTDADAVLSRAEAALRDGQLENAVEELQALQSPAKEAMAEWQAEAQQRLNLVGALKSLSAVVGN